MDINDAAQKECKEYKIKYAILLEIKTDRQGSQAPLKSR
jgi:hypothetical protein